MAADPVPAEKFPAEADDESDIEVPAEAYAANVDAADLDLADELQHLRFKEMEGHRTVKDTWEIGAPIYYHEPL